MRIVLSLVIIVALSLSGCAATRLRYHATRQATTLSDIEEQQILDNIAMFVANPGSTPYFALPTGGGTTTAQETSGTANLLWNPHTLVTETGIFAQKAGVTENWTLKPINDPERIELMKCVYQHVTQCQSGDDCLECQKKLINFFGPNFAGCSVPSCWFTVSNKRPKRSNCCVKTGHYCGTYIQVSAENFDFLSRVTVAILDISTVDSVALTTRLNPQPPSIVIEETFDVVVGDKKRTIKGTRKVPVDVYGSMLPNSGAGESAEKFDIIPLEPFGTLRPRRETGPSIESLIQMNGSFR